MRATVVLLALALAATGAVAVAPTAAACPDPDYPCDPTPYDPLDCPGLPKSIVACLKEKLP